MVKVELIDDKSSGLYELLRDYCIARNLEINDENMKKALIAIKKFINKDDGYKTRKRGFRYYLSRL